ncbi:MAG: peptide chain release factor N(5)-glutamine methyltransferase [Xanthomonadales bacterium]|nr:peptide chain release factor N(5)-glutamine methyltransferase [Xanthomonadales bacterium]
MPSVRDVLIEARQKLSSLQVEAASNSSGNASTSSLDAELLLAEVMQVGRSFFYSDPNAEPSWAQLEDFQQLLQRRLGGEPVAYLLGRQEFWSLVLKVNAATLIPRPETELLVELTLAKLDSTESCRIADLGTGSGAIALALASERPGWQITATDISAEALKVAEENRQAHHLENVILRQGEWLSALQGKFHAVVSNPPYIAAADPHLSSGNIRFEPELALTPGADGLASFRQISAQAGDYLLPGGWLLFEHGFDQADQVQCMLLAAGMDNIETLQDLEGLDRVTIGQYLERG